MGLGLGRLVYSLSLQSEPELTAKFAKVLRKVRKVLYKALRTLRFYKMLYDKKTLRTLRLNSAQTETEN